MNNLPSSRKSACAAGSKRYFTGKPCSVYGHAAERLTTNGTCIECVKSIKGKSQRNNKEKVNAYHREYRQRCGERIRERERIARKERPHIFQAATSRYKKRRPDLHAATSARRRAKILQRTPSWADMHEIGKFYSEARRITLATGIQHDVDHIVPLLGRNVCGLHVESNLQILDFMENRRKNNKLIGDCGVRTVNATECPTQFHPCGRAMRDFRLEAVKP